ncbi:MAG: hypothetical protein ACLTYN_01475 [Dysosmobacter welbionis]
MRRSLLQLRRTGDGSVRHAAEVRPGDIFDYAREHADILLMPDQDVLNGLYGGQILGWTTACGTTTPGGLTATCC